MYATILFSLFACTQMENPGEPFSPVQIAEENPEESSTTKDIDEPLEEDQKESIFDPAGTILVVSEIEEKDSNDVVEKTSPKEELPQKAENLEETSGALKKQGVEKEDGIVLEKNIAVPQRDVAYKALPSVGVWPLRVVKTEANLNPPRAILGLPNGEEIVIRAGMQLPEENIIVMSIGSKAVVLARIHPEGDHARVEHLTLPSLND